MTLQSETLLTQAQFHNWYKTERREDLQKKWYDSLLRFDQLLWSPVHTIGNCTSLNLDFVATGDNFPLTSLVPPRLKQVDVKVHQIAQTEIKIWNVHTILKHTSCEWLFPGTSPLPFGRWGASVVVGRDIGLGGVTRRRGRTPARSETEAGVNIHASHTVQVT